MRVISANILLLWYDDDQEDLEYFKFILDELQVAKYVLCYRKEDFDQNLTSDINLILVDHMLGSTTGLEVIRDVKKANKENFAIVVSAIRDFDVAVEYINAGANWFVKKGEIDYKEKLTEGVRFGFTEAHERIKHAHEMAEYKAAKERELNEHATNLIDLIDRGTTQ